MSKRYKIEITEFSVEEKIYGKRWEQGAAEGADDGKGNYGYTPEIKKMQDVERKVYEQNTDEIDLKAIIRAINGL